MTLLHQAAQKAVEAKQREAFEHWYSDAGRWPKSVARGEDGHYLLAQTNSSYEAWRAAAAALQHQEEPSTAVIPPAPPECETEDEKTAFSFGYWQGLHAARKGQEVPRELVAPGLVDCGECRTQGCPAGRCRNAASPSTTRQQEDGNV